MITSMSNVLGPVDITAASIVKAVGTGSAYDKKTVQLIADCIVGRAGDSGLLASFLAGQILHETGNLRFGGDVQPDQFTFAGLGATGGVPGLSFSDVDTGIRAVVAHHMAYIYGPVSKWPEATQAFVKDDPRAIFVVAGPYAGSVKIVSDYGSGKWAASPSLLYSAAIVRWGNECINNSDPSKVTPAIVPTPIVPKGEPLKVALAAGHHNSDGGNSIEYDLVGPLTHAYHEAFTAVGADVRVITPEDGSGQFPGGLQDVARKVVEWSNDGWEAELFLECHTNGSNGTRGAFGIYPDSGSDVDTEARDNLIPAMVRAGTAATGIPIYGDGTMSEKVTGVGASGYRLGIFLVTEPLAETCTRLIIEHGAHDSSADLAIMQGLDFNKRWAGAVVSEVMKYYGIEIVDSPPEPLPATGETYFPETGYYLRYGFRDFYYSRGAEAIAFYGFPISNEIVENGLTVQYFQRCRFEWHPGSGGFPPNPQDVMFGLVGSEAMAAKAEVRAIQTEVPHPEIAEDIGSSTAKNK